MATTFCGLLDELKREGILRMKISFLKWSGFWMNKFPPYSNGAECDPEMQHTKNGRQWYFGMNAHEQA